MDKEALAEVDDIISLLSKEYQSKIPKKLKEFIKKNKDSLYKSNITELPRDFQIFSMKLNRLTVCRNR